MLQACVGLNPNGSLGSVGILVQVRIEYLPTAGKAGMQARPQQGQPQGVVVATLTEAGTMAQRIEEALQGA